MYFLKEKSMKEKCERNPEEMYFQDAFEKCLGNLPTCNTKEAERQRALLEKFTERPLDEGVTVEKFANVLVFKNAKQNKRYDMWVGNDRESAHIEILAEALPANSPEYENSLRNYGSGEIFVLSDGARILYYKHGRHQEEIAAVKNDFGGIRDVMDRYRLQALLSIRFEKEGEKFFNVSYFRHGDAVQRVESRSFSKEVRRRLEEDLWESRIREIARENNLNDPREYRAFRLRARAIFESGSRVSGSDTLEEIVKEYVRGNEWGKNRGKSEGM